MQPMENPARPSKILENIISGWKRVSLVTGFKSKPKNSGLTSQSLATLNDTRGMMTGFTSSFNHGVSFEQSIASSPNPMHLYSGTQQNISFDVSSPTPIRNPETSENFPNQEVHLQSAIQDQKGLAESNQNNQNDEIQQNKKTRDEVKAVLKKVFMFYASFGDRMNSDNIKSNKIFKMMQDCQVIEPGVLNKKSLDLLFCQYSKNRPSMSFDIFLSMLIKIGQIKFPDQDPKQAFLMLFEQHLKPLYGNLYAETDMGDYDVLFKEPLDRPIVAILTNVKGVLQKMHQTCFPLEYEVKNENPELQSYIKHKTETCLGTFLKDFDVCPSLLTKSTAYSLFVEVLETPIEQLTHNPEISVIVQPDIGNRFTLARFMTYLARLALVGYSPDNFTRNNQEYFKLSNGDKLLLLLERLEFSMGYVNFERKMNATHNNRTKIVPNKQFLKKLSEETGEQYGKVRLENFQSLLQKSSSEWTANQMGDPNFQTPEDDGQTGRFMAPPNQTSSLAMSKSKRNLSANRSTSNLACPGIFEKRREFLLQVYRSHALFNGQTNNYRLNAMKFLKLLRSIGLVKEVSGNSFVNNSGVKLKRVEDSPQKNTGYQVENPSTINDLRRGVTPTEVDLIFIKAAGGGTLNNQRSFANLTLDAFRNPLGSPNRSLNESTLALQGKFLDFEQFLKAIKLIAEKLYPEYSLDISVSHLLDVHLALADTGSGGVNESPLNENLGVKKLVGLLKDPDTVDVLSKLKESLHPYFNYYAGKGGRMSSEQFMRFCKDFGIFPEVLPKSKLIQNFSDLATLQPILRQKSQERSKSPNSQPKSHQDTADELRLIDVNLFTEVLALSATDIEDNVSAHPIEKILFLLEKMSQSSGPKNTLKLLRRGGAVDGDYFKVFGYIRKKYHKFAKFAETTKHAKIIGAKEIPFSYLFD